MIYKSGGGWGDTKRRCEERLAGVIGCHFMVPGHGVQQGDFLASVEL